MFSLSSDGLEVVREPEDCLTGEALAMGVFVVCGLEDVTMASAFCKTTKLAQTICNGRFILFDSIFMTNGGRKRIRPLS